MINASMNKLSKAMSGVSQAIINLGKAISNNDVKSFQNRDFLRDFVSLNKIKTTLVSKQLGYSRNWLTQAMNRTDRGDLTDEELQAIMKQLHVDWTQDTFIYVKATKTHSAYRTRPCVYEHAKHKELLQRAFWDGRIVNGR